MIRPSPSPIGDTDVLGPMGYWPAPDPSSPYFCHGPTLVSFSGGRTSAYMLWMTLCAHGGVLPDDVYVVFCNTGREREETLRFVYECGIRWAVRIWWLEWLAGAGNAAEDRYSIVGYNSASRRGEPLRALFRRRKYLPNAVTRFCTAEAKIQTMKQFMQSKGLKSWMNMVGLRADEPKRLIKQVLRNLAGKECWKSICPLAVAGVIKKHVMRHWLGRNKFGTDRRYRLPQGFDLGLDDHEGNCDACFLKGFHVLAHIERQRPGTLDPWIEDEDMVTALIASGETADKPMGARFVTEYTYRQVRDYARSSAELPALDTSEIGDCTGEVCIVDSSEEEVDDETVVWLVDYLAKLQRDPAALPSPPPKQEAAIGDLFGEAA